MADDRNTIAREYLRVSIDRSGRERSPEEQHDDNRRVAEQRGWTLGEAYGDVGSASRYAKNGRDGYDTLVADLKAGRFGADVLMLWESSRGSRRVGEWVTLIELCEDQHVLIHVTSHNRTYDPANWRDRRSLLEDSVDSEAESAKISERIRRAMRANAARGRPQGRIPFGYRRVYDDRTGALVRQEPEPAEAAIVRELYDRLARGHSLRAIARDLEARGVRSRSGTVLSAQQLRDMALKRAYNGQREHKGAVTEGQWPALVDRAVWLDVHRRLTTTERRQRRPGRAHHLLSMIAVCDACSGPLTSRRRGEQMHYRCHVKGCVTVGYDELTDLAERVILGYLSRPDNVERLTTEDHGKELDAVRLSMAEIRAELREVYRLAETGEMSDELLIARERGIQRRLKAAQDRYDELSTPSRLRWLVDGPADEMRMRWDAAPIAARREVARVLLDPAVLGELRVTRSPTPGHRVPVVDRVVWRPA